MPLPAPYSAADDRQLVDGCAGGDEDAWAVLEGRYGPLVELVAVRVVDERRAGTLEEVPGCVDAVGAHLRRNSAGPLRTWGGQSLRHYLAVIARQVSMEYLQDVTPPATLIASLPTPAAIFLDEMLAVEPAKQITEALDRLSPNIGALVRLRLRGLDRADIAATLGRSQQGITTNLEKVATRLGEMTDHDLDDARAAWRVLLDAAPVAERVEVAMRTESDPAFRKVRTLAEATWRSVRERALTRLHPKQGMCLDENQLATFVDGTLRGAERTRAEGHVATCPRCIDTVATLTMDMRAADWRRDAASMDPQVGLAAACVATTRFRAGELLGEQAAASGSERARSMVRLARVGQMLRSGAERQSSEPSRVRSVTSPPPSDEEAPLVALEALVADDTGTAARAIDDELAKGTLGTRLRLLAEAGGQDVASARRRALALTERSHPDPGLLDDAAAALALPEGVALPRETLVERLRDALPQAVRFVLSS